MSHARRRRECRRAPAPIAVLALSLLGFAPAGSAAADPGKPPTIDFGESAVTVDGVPLGHSALLFGFGQDVKNFVMTLRRWEAILEHDGEDDLTLELDRPVPFASVWVAVDLTTGLAAAAAPEGMPLRELPPAPHAPTETAAAVDLELRMAELVLIRPGGSFGAWGARVGDGGADDADSLTDDGLRAAIAGMWSVGDSPKPPAALKAGDVLLVVDPQELRYSATTVGSKGGHEK